MSELPKGWAETRLGELIQLQYGKSLPQSNRVPGPYSVYGSNGPVGTHTAAITAAPAIIVGRKGSIGEVHFSSTPCFPIDTTYFIDRFDACSPRFAEHLLKSLPLSEMNRATAIPGLNREDAYALTVGLPPLAEQQRMVAKLDTLTGAIHRAATELGYIPALIARYKQTILSAAFEGELTREWRAKQEVNAGIPVVRLGEVAKDLSYGSSAKSSKQGEVPVLRMGNIQSGALDWDDLVYTSDPAETNKYLLTSGDVLFNRTNSPELVGKTAVFRGERKAIFAGYLIRVRCAGNMLPEYLGFCLSSPQGRDYCWRVKTDGVSQSNINAKKLAAFSFRLPSIDEQREIVRRVQTALDWLDRVAAEREQAVRLLPRLDQAILAEAFCGQLVPQSPDDEPASVLLERVRAARPEAPKRGRELRLRGTGEIEFTGTGSLTVAQKEQDMRTRTDVSPNYLSDIVKKSGGQIKADALWRLSEMSIDEFYKQLRNEINMGFVREGANKELLEFADAA